MIIKENVTLFICQHCRKRYQVKRSCENHEQWCKNNPDNWAKCGGCTYLQEKQKEIWPDDRENPKQSKSFFCRKKQIEVYPLIVARLKLPEKYPDDFEGAERMPKECDFFTDQPVYDSSTDSWIDSDLPF